VITRPTDRLIPSPVLCNELGPRLRDKEPSTLQRYVGSVASTTNSYAHRLLDYASAEISENSSLLPATSPPPLQRQRSSQPEPTIIRVPRVEVLRTGRLCTAVNPVNKSPSCAVFARKPNSLGMLSNEKAARPARPKPEIPVRLQDRGPVIWRIRLLMDLRIISRPSPIVGIGFDLGRRLYAKLVTRDK